jgi:hypothetical protein
MVRVAGIETELHASPLSPASPESHSDAETVQPGTKEAWAVRL